MRGHSIKVIVLHPADGLAQPDDARDVRRAGLELEGQLGIGGLLEGDHVDHLAAALPRRHLVQQFFEAVEYAGTGGAIALMSAEGIEIAA